MRFYRKGWNHLCDNCPLYDCFDWMHACLVRIAFREYNRKQAEKWRANPENKLKQKEYQGRYNHSEKGKARNREGQRRRRVKLENREKEREYQRKYSQTENGKARSARSSKKYYKNNKDALKIYKRKFYQQNYSKAVRIL